jgi:hypothetical protein
MKRWLAQYWICTRVLHAYGEHAWPWNVRYIWTYVGREYLGADI